MAITGSGTFSNPFVVHDYAELYQVRNGGGTGYSYVKLANDIDGNDVETTWNLYNNSGGGLDLNLNGHGIKNVTLDFNGNDTQAYCNLLPNNRTYATTSSSIQAYPNRIHDGFITNVKFKNIHQTSPIGYSTFRRVFISIVGEYKNVGNVETTIAPMFDHCWFDKCTGSLTAHFNDYRDNTGEFLEQYMFNWCTMFGCDFATNITDLCIDVTVTENTASGIFKEGESYTTTYIPGCGMECTLLKGSITGEGNFEHTLSLPFWSHSTYNHDQFRNIINLNYLGCTPSSPSVTYDIGGSEYNITNTDLKPSQIHGGGWGMTTAQMLDPAEYPNVYFPVTAN